MGISHFNIIARLLLTQCCFTSNMYTFVCTYFTLPAPNCTLPVLDNGNVTLQDGSQVTDVVPAGLAVIFRCNIGFTLNGHSELTCDASGKLNGTAPNCTSTYKYSK